MKKKQAAAKKPADDFLTQEAKEEARQAPAYTLDIPEDEIWTYQIEGLQAPRIGKPIRNLRRKKIIVVAVLLVAISLAIFFSLRALFNDTFQYKALDDGTYELVKFSNPGDITTLKIDYANGNEDNPISTLHEFAFNCDDKLLEITIGKTVTSIAPTTFYSCWNLQTIRVDKDNPAYCDLDGVLYTKDLTRVVCYPVDHDKYLREKTCAWCGKQHQEDLSQIAVGFAHKIKADLFGGAYGYTHLKDDDGKPMEELWEPTERYDEAFFEEYNRAVRTYVVPSTVTVIGEMAFNYANLVDIYLPEGLVEIETLALFKSTSLHRVFGYTCGEENLDTTADAIGAFSKVYPSLPEGLLVIGSDAFSYDQALDYLYLPASIQKIGHHAFWDTWFKGGGIREINAALSEDAFASQVEQGDQWRPQYDVGLLKKSVAVNYDAQRAE